MIDCFDKLVIMVESYYWVIIMEVMGCDVGWIVLYMVIVGGVEVCLFFEIFYDVCKIKKMIDKCYCKGKGFMNIVMVEGVKFIGGSVFG